MRSILLTAEPLWFFFTPSQEKSIMASKPTNIRCIWSGSEPSVYKVESCLILYYDGIKLFLYCDHLLWNLSERVNFNIKDMFKMLCIWLNCYANFHSCIYGLVPSLLHSTHTHTDNQIRIILESTKLIGFCPLTFIFK